MDGELWHFDGSTARFHMAPGLLDRALRSLTVASDGMLRVASGTTEGEWKLFGLGPDQARVDAGPLAFGPEGEIWI